MRGIYRFQFSSSAIQPSPDTFNISGIEYLDQSPNILFGVETASISIDMVAPTLQAFCVPLTASDFQPVAVEICSMLWHMYRISPAVRRSGPQALLESAAHRHPRRRRALNIHMLALFWRQHFVQLDVGWSNGRDQKPWVNMRCKTNVTQEAGSSALWSKLTSSVKQNTKLWKPRAREHLLELTQIHCHTFSSAMAVRLLLPPRGVGKLKPWNRSGHSRAPKRLATEMTIILRCHWSWRDLVRFKRTRVAG